MSSRQLSFSACKQYLLPENFSALWHLLTSTPEGLAEVYSQTSLELDRNNSSWELGSTPAENQLIFHVSIVKSEIGVLDSSNAKPKMSECGVEFHGSKPHAVI
jgi:hypothetical protein